MKNMANLTVSIRNKKCIHRFEEKQIHIGKGKKKPIELPNQHWKKKEPNNQLEVQLHYFPNPKRGN